MKFWGVLLVILCVIGVIGFILLSRLHANDVLTPKEKEQALRNMLGRSAMLQEKVHDTSTKIFNGQYLHVTYPADAKIYTSSSGQAQNTFSFGIVDEHVVVSTGVYANTNKLTEYGGIVLRRNQKDIYKENTITFQGLACLSFVKTEDGAEESFFCQKNGRILSFAVTTTDLETVKKYVMLFSPTIVW